MNSDLQIFVDQFTRFFQPVILAVSSPANAESLLFELGYTPPAQMKLFDNLKTSVGAVEDLIDSLSQISDDQIEANPELLITTVKNAIQTISTLISDLQNISTFLQSDQAFATLIAQTDILEKLPLKLFDLLVTKYLKQFSKKTYSVLRLFGIIEINEIPEPPNLSYSPHVERIFHWENISALLSSPLDLLEANIKSNGNYIFDKTLNVFQEVAHSIGLIAYYKAPVADVLKFINNNPTIDTWPGFAALEILRFPLIPGDLFGFGLDIYPLINTADSTVTGLVTVIGFDPETKEIDLTDTLKLNLEFSGSISNGFGISIDANNHFTFIDDLLGSPQQVLDDTQLEFKASVTRKDDSTDGTGQKLVQMGTPGSSQLEIGSFQLDFGFEKNKTTRLYFEAGLQKGLIVIKFGDADGFITKVLGSGIQGNFDIGIGFSSDKGIYFTGSSGLEITIPTHVNLGPLQIQSLSVSAVIKNNEPLFSFAGSVLVSLGPLQIVVQNIGLSLQAGISSVPSLGFKPPDGAGLSIDAGGITGGGFLRYDDVNKEYTGALELSFKDLFSLKAFGIISTLMPDGSSGFSLLVVITAEFTPVQLGFGFTLNGVGGLLGLNRTTKVDVLKQGIKTDAIESILFPQNVVANINRIISDIKQVFPPQQGHFLLCPMGKFGWGTPTLITIELGLLIEIPASGFKILGVVKALLPDEDEPLLKLQVNFLGEIDFDNKYISFIATLYDSKLLTFTLTGDMAFRILFGDQPLFLLSVGGFHPSFTQVPADLKNMKRLTISLYDGDSASITLQSYFAVTSNTVQFGAKAELFAGSKSGFNIYGFLNYDVLFQFSPFHFDADLSGGVSLRNGTSTIMGINVTAELSGPGPWDAHGEASVSFFFFSVSVPFHVTWGSADNALPAITADLLTLLTNEINADTNWLASIPPINKLHVTIKKITPPDGVTIVHPFGSLSFSERLLPLGVKVDHFGNEVPQDADQFDIGPTDASLAVDSLSEEFAAANFFNMSDDEKLSRPSFEPMKSGFKITGSAALKISTGMVIRKVEYEVSYPGKENQPLNIFQYPASIFQAHLKSAAVSQSSLSLLRNRISLNAPAAVAIQEEQYVLANTSDMKQFGTTAVTGTYTEILQQYNTLVKNNPQLTDQLQVLSTYEVNPN